MPRGNLLPIGLDSVSAYWDYPGVYFFEESVWKRYLHRSEKIKYSRGEYKGKSRVWRWKLKACQSPSARGLKLLGFRTIDPVTRAPFTRFILEFSPNRIKAGRLTAAMAFQMIVNPAMPEDADGILDFVASFVDRNFPLAHTAPIRSDAWKVTGFDLNVDFSMPHVLYNAITRGFQSLGFARGKSEVFFFNKKLIPKSEREFEKKHLRRGRVSKWENEITGVSLRNSGKSKNRQHVLYYKAEQLDEQLQGQFCHLSSDARREEIRFRGKAMLEAVDMESRKIEEVLRYASRTHAVQVMLGKQGVFALPTLYDKPWEAAISVEAVVRDCAPRLARHNIAELDPKAAEFHPLGVVWRYAEQNDETGLPDLLAGPLKSCLPSAARPVVRARYLQRDKARRTVIQLILSHLDDDARKLMKSKSYKPPPDFDFKRLRRQWHKKGLFLANPVENCIFSLYLAHWLHAPNGCHLPMLEWDSFGASMEENEEATVLSPQRRFPVPAPDQPDPDGGAVDAADTPQPGRGATGRVQPGARRRTAGERTDGHTSPARRKAAFPCRSVRCPYRLPRYRTHSHDKVVVPCKNLQLRFLQRIHR